MDNYNESLIWFEHLYDLFPNHYEGIELYSNILFVKGNNGRLAEIAQKMFNMDKFLPQTNLVVGNYYALK